MYSLYLILGIEQLYFQAGTITRFVPFTPYEWEEGFEILVFEQFAFSNSSNNFLHSLKMFYYSVYGLGNRMLHFYHNLLLGEM